MKFVHAFFLCALLTFLPVIESVADVYSSNIWSADCETLYIDEAAGDISQLCSGYGGYQLITHESDLRQSIDVVTPTGEGFLLGFWHHITPYFSLIEENVLWSLDKSGDPQAFGVTLVYAKPQASGDSRDMRTSIIVKISESTTCVVFKNSGRIEATEFNALAERSPEMPCIYEPETHLVLGTITELQAGDRGCYLTATDGKGREIALIGLFLLCEQPAKLLGQEVYLNYTDQWLASPTCEGDPECRTGSSVKVVSAAHIRKGNTCDINEESVFSCDSIAACWNTASETLHLISDGNRLSFDADQLSWGFIPFAGGGGAWLKGSHDEASYALYTGTGRWAADGLPGYKAGLARFEKSVLKELTSCQTQPDSVLGPDWLHEHGFAEDPNELDFSVLPALSIK